MTCLTLSMVTGMQLRAFPIDFPCIISFFPLDFLMEKTITKALSSIILNGDDLINVGQLLVHSVHANNSIFKPFYPH